MKMLKDGRGPVRLAVVVVVAGLAVAAFAGSAVGHGDHAARSDAARGAALGVPPSLMKSARWITLRDGKRIRGVPLTIGLSRGRLVVQPRSYGNCAYCHSHNNRGSGMCMSSYPNSQGSGISEYGCNGGPNQEWVYAVYTDNEPYLFAYNANNLCLNNLGGGFSNGNRIGLWSCNSGAPSMWFGAGGSDWNGWLLLHLFSGFQTWSYQCVTTLPGRGNGGPIDQWTCDRGSTWQAWGGDWGAVSAPGAADRP
jgi:hypothetical protein